MKIYFLSALTAALKVGGAYFGVIDDFEKFADVSLSDKLLVECIPQGALPVAFFLDENLLASPPDGVDVYLLKDGLALFVREYPPSDYLLRPILEKRAASTLVTLFRQGKLQAAIDSPKGVFVTPLPDEFERANIEIFGKYVLLQTERAILVLSDEGEILLDRRAERCERTNEKLSVLSPVFDSLGRRKKEVFSLGESFFRTEFSLLIPERTPNDRAALFAYAFFEAVLVGADVAPFLSPELNEKADDIKGFLGEFTAVTLTSEPNTVGLVKRKRERVFEVCYYTAEIENGKIVDIKG